MDDEAVIALQQKLMEKVDEMRKQRDNFEQQFRDQVHKDDITSSLVTREDGNQQVSVQLCNDPASYISAFLSVYSFLKFNWD